MKCLALRETVDMRKIVLLVMLVISGCSTVQRPLPISSDPQPVLTIKKTELDELVVLKWGSASKELLKESRFNEETRARALRMITVAGLGPLQCSSSGQYSVVRIEHQSSVDGAAKDEVWVVDICGEQRCTFDTNGKVIQVGDVQFGNK
jgi:hypothetical protein